MPVSASVSASCRASFSLPRRLVISLPDRSTLDCRSLRWACIALVSDRMSEIIPFRSAASTPPLRLPEQGLKGLAVFRGVFAGAGDGGENSVRHGLEPGWNFVAHYLVIGEKPVVDLLAALSGDGPLVRRHHVDGVPQLRVPPRIILVPDRVIVRCKGDAELLHLAERGIGRYGGGLKIFGVHGLRPVSSVSIWRLRGVILRRKYAGRTIPGYMSKRLKKG